jgi:glycosyltransferase involved in cell wall biosynthesis
MSEAMACGTPVLATPCASVPEVVQEGVTGFIRADADGLAEAAGRLGELDRAACRRRVAERFSKSAMATAYDRVVRALASQGRAGNGTLG